MINKNVFWIFALMLMIITISGSLSNALEINENFLEEVLELNDANEQHSIYGYSEYPLYSNVENCSEENIEEEDDIKMKYPSPNEILRPVAPQPQYQPQPQPQPQHNHHHHHHHHRVPVNLHKPQPILNNNFKSENEMLSGYSGQFYAPF